MQVQRTSFWSHGVVAKHTTEAAKKLLFTAGQAKETEAHAQKQAQEKYLKSKGEQLQKEDQERNQM